MTVRVRRSSWRMQVDDMRNRPRAQDLLLRVAAANDRGTAPDKHAVCGEVAPATRGRWYATLDLLIGRGYLANGHAAPRYALRVTDAGRAMLTALGYCDDTGSD